MKDSVWEFLKKFAPPPPEKFPEVAAFVAMHPLTARVNSGGPIPISENGTVPTILVLRDRPDFPGFVLILNPNVAPGVIVMLNEKKEIIGMITDFE